MKSIDRFSSKEDPEEFNEEAMEEGRIARIHGFKKLARNFYLPRSFMWKSFNAGWSDVDMDELNHE